VLQDLTHLTLGLDFEQQANDSLVLDHDFAWYRRCLFRRLHATQVIAEVCLKLEHCDWQQIGKDSEGNDMTHAFDIVVEEGELGNVRVVKTIRQWWMCEQYEARYDGPLPEGIVDDPNAWY